MTGIITPMTTNFAPYFLKIAPMLPPTFMPMETRNSIRKNTKNKLLTTPVLSTEVALA